MQEAIDVLSVRLRAKATALPAQKEELVSLVKALRKTLTVSPPPRRLQPPRRLRASTRGG